LARSLSFPVSISIPPNFDSRKNIENKNLRINFHIDELSIFLLVELGVGMLDWTSRNSGDEGGGQHQGNSVSTHGDLGLDGFVTEVIDCAGAIDEDGCRTELSSDE
jgi:hypothetical protein